MSNNNEPADEADNNNEQHNRENNQNQNNPPEWAAFPDLLRVQEPQQNGAGPETVHVMQRAGTSNPPDVSLPGAAGRDPPPPDFDLDVILGSNQNQRLPDMALDANQAHQHRSLPDMAPEAAGVPRERSAAGLSCGGARFRPRRVANMSGNPGSLAQMAQAVAASSADNGIDTHQDPINARFQELEEQVQALRVHVSETNRTRSDEASRILDELASLRRSIDLRSQDSLLLEHRLIKIESLIQRMIIPRPQVSEDAVYRTNRARERHWQRRETERMSRLLAESLHMALTHFMQQLENVDNAEDDSQADL